MLSYKRKMQVFIEYSIDSPIHLIYIPDMNESSEDPGSRRCREKKNDLRESALRIISRVTMTVYILCNIMAGCLSVIYGGVQ